MKKSNSILGIIEQPFANGIERSLIQNPETGTVAVTYDLLVNNRTGESTIASISNRNIDAFMIIQDLIDMEINDRGQKNFFHSIHILGTKMLALF